MQTLPYDWVEKIEVWNAEFGSSRLGVMTSFQVNTEVLAEKLKALNTTQQVIESVSQWCIFYRRDAQTIVLRWEMEFHTSTPEKKLSLLYLTNDILQNSRKKGKEFASEFLKVIPKALKSLWADGNEKVNRAVLRLVGIWEERRVFPGKSFRSCLSKPDKSGDRIEGVDSRKLTQEPAGSPEVATKLDGDLEQLAGVEDFAASDPVDLAGDFKSTVQFAGKLFGNEQVKVKLIRVVCVCQQEFILLWRGN